METITVERRCPCCNTIHTVTVPAAGFREWRQGKKHIQDALPTVSIDDRELLMSGLCKDCWDAMTVE